MNNFLQLIANKALFLNFKTELLSYSSIQQKICYSLLNEFDAKENNIITLPFSKKTWAESLNVSRPSLYRELKSLENYNLLKCIGNNKIGIINANGLSDLITCK
ncbi:helix-turn-helix domain-containing protein [Clostridium sporogenes]